MADGQRLTIVSHGRDDQGVAAVPPWELVRRWPGLRGEDKLAWLYLWSRSRQGGAQVSLTAAEVGADQGTTADAGRQRIRNLDREGLIRIFRHERVTGVFFLECLEPDAVRRAKPVEWDGQRVFGFLTEQTFTDELLSESGQSDAIAGRVSGSAGEAWGQDATEDPPEVPRCHRGSSGGSSVRAYLQEPSIASANPGPSTFGALAAQGFERRSQEVSARCGRRGSAGGSSAGEPAGLRRPFAGDESAGGSSAGEPAGLRRPFAGDETAALAALIEARRAEAAPRRVEREPAAVGRAVEARAVALPQITPASHQAARETVESLTAEIRQRVGDPKLAASWCGKVAWAVVQGDVDRAVLYQLLACCDKVRDPARPTWTRPSERQPQGVPLSAYFVIGSKRLCAKRGIDLQSGRKPR